MGFKDGILREYHLNLKGRLLFSLLVLTSHLFHSVHTELIHWHVVKTHQRDLNMLLNSSSETLKMTASETVGAAAGIQMPSSELEKLLHDS